MMHCRALLYWLLQTANLMGALQFPLTRVPWMR